MSCYRERGIRTEPQLPDPLILGVDPGVRNIGFAVVNGVGRCLRQVTLVNPRALPFSKCVAAMVRWMEDLQVCPGYDTIVVEEVIWRGRKGMLPLAHVAGAALGVALGMGCRAYLITPSMKKNGRKPASYSEHSWDAFLLAKRALKPDDTMRRRCSGPFVVK